MAEAHASFAWIVFWSLIVFTVAALLFAWFEQPPRWLEAARRGVIVLLLVQAALGAAAFADGRRPTQGLHILYGVVAVGGLPLAGAIASEAPARARAAVLVLGSILTLLLLWRALATG